MTESESRLVKEAEAAVRKSDREFTRFHKAVYTMLLTVFIAAFSTIGYWYFEPPPTKNYKRELITKEVYPGGFVRLHVSVEWTKTCYSRLRRNIVYSNGVLVPYEREIRLNKMGVRDFVISQQLPEDAPPGVAKWVVLTDWFCNPLQYFWPQTINLDPLEFKILPSKGNNNEGKLPEMPKTGSCLGRGFCKPS